MTACTGLTAMWCPVHGDCKCHEDSLYENKPGPHDADNCPLHSPTSDHAEGEVES